MFGISFSELLLVGLVALLVLGPERLPGAARTAGLWIGRLKRSFNAIKQEVEREIGADEIRRQLHNEHILSLEEEARKIMQPQQTAVQPPAEQVAPFAAETAAPAANQTPVHSTESSPVEPARHSPPPASASEPAHPVAETEPVTHTSSVPSAPSANDSSLPPRAP
jgi:sec-independent protein translocase protein TatB